MNTLTTSPASDVLARLFAEAERGHGPRVDRRSPQSSPEDRPRDSMEFFARARDEFMAVSRQTADLLYILARARSARSVVEFGTSFGISTLCLAAAVRDNGGGIVIGTEFLPNKVEAVRRTLAEAGLGDVSEIRAGDARTTLADGVPDPVDLLFLDGAKEMYVGVLHMIERHLPDGALVVADNAGRADGYQDYMRGSGGYVSVGFESDVEVSVRIADARTPAA